MSKITAYIIAYNEQEKIAAAVNSVLWADEVLVIDSNSQDKTAEIATALGANVIQVPFNGFGDLRNRALEHCQHEWIFSLDADERCTPEAQQEILSIVNDSASVDLYFTPRKNYFMGRWIKHSGWYPNYRQPQLFKKGMMTYTLDQVHESFVNKSDQPIGYMKRAIVQIPFRNLEQVVAKANRYSTLGVDRLEKKGKRPCMLSGLLHATWSFIRHYFIKLGVLDGWPGFIIAFGNFEGTFYRYAKFYERKNNLTWSD